MAEEKVLIVASGRGGQAVSELISEFFPDWQQSRALTAREAKSLISDRSFDMVVVNCPVGEDSGTGIAAFVAECSNAGCVLLAKAEDIEILRETAESTGSAVVRKQPLNKTAFRSALKLVSSLRRRLLCIGSQSFGRTDEELKTIGRAKLALMQYLKFTEEQANRYLEKQAMDLRIPKSEAALRVIKMYDQ